MKMTEVYKTKDKMNCTQALDSIDKIVIHRGKVNNSDTFINVNSN